MVGTVCSCLLCVNVVAPHSYCFGSLSVCPAVSSVNIMLCSARAAHRWLNKLCSCPVYSALLLSGVRWPSSTASCSRICPMRLFTSHLSFYCDATVYEVLCWRSAYRMVASSVNETRVIVFLCQKFLS